MKMEINREIDITRTKAEEFPLMIVLSILYPCNFGCPNCPYTDGNSAIRRFYREKKGELMPLKLWQKIAKEAGEYGAWLRCTGGGEPMLHPQMVEMILFAKQTGARIWLNSNGSMFGPFPKHRKRLEQIIGAGIDLIEFSMDAGDPETYAQLRPLRRGSVHDCQKRWEGQVANIQAALSLRESYQKPTRIVVSIIQQEALEGKMEQAVRFWREAIGVDNVITRKFLTWDDNTQIPSDTALDPHLYANLPSQPKEPCVWLFERLNIDTLGRVALCGQDIAFRTSGYFPTVWEESIKEIWQGKTFSEYRRKHLSGKGAECYPCRGCSAWKAGIRDWTYGWLKVLKDTDKRLSITKGQAVSKLIAPYA